jgi:MFS family permease
VSAAQPFPPRQIAAILIVGVIGVLIPGLQPQLLGALAAEGRLSVSALGLLATAELLAMGFGAGGAGFVLGAVPLRRTAIGALVAIAALDMLTPMAGPAGLFAARVVAGLAEGVLIWLAIGFIIRSTSPERWSGIYLAIQTAAQFGIATLLGFYVIPGHGANGGLVWLGALTLAGLLAVPWLPCAWPALAAAQDTSGAPPVRGLIALGGIVFYLAFVVAIWVYLEPIGLHRGIAPATLHFVVPVSLAMQVLGAGTATLLADRIPARPTVVLVAIVNLGLLALISIASGTAFVVATAIFGFLWLFVMPFQIPLVMAADPSNRAAMLIGGAQLTGSSLGPLIAAMLVSDTNPMPALWFGAACAVIGVAILLGAASNRAATNQGLT